VGCDRGRCVIGTSSTYIVSIVYADFERILGHVGAMVETLSLGPGSAHCEEHVIRIDPGGHPLHHVGEVSLVLPLEEGPLGAGGAAPDGVAGVGVPEHEPGVDAGHLGWVGG
jgi:hypothetical protein